MPITVGRSTSLISRWQKALFISLQSSTGIAVRYCPGGYQTQWIQIFAWTLWMRPYRTMVNLIYSTQTSVPSLPVKHSQKSSRKTTFELEWIVKDDGLIMSLSNESGAV